MPFFYATKEEVIIFEIDKPMNQFYFIQEVKKNRVILMSGEEITILKVQPINFKLKSEVEREKILESYQSFLKQCDFDMQIFIETGKADIENHLKAIEKCLMYEPYMQDMAEDYIQLIKEISEVRGSISRKFYIVIKTNDKRKHWGFINFSISNIFVNSNIEKEGV